MIVDTREALSRWDTIKMVGGDSDDVQETGDELARCARQLAYEHELAIGLLEEYIASQNRMRDSLAACRKQAELRANDDGTFTSPGWKTVMARTGEGLYGDGTVTAGVVTN